MGCYCTNLMNSRYSSFFLGIVNLFIITVLLTSPSCHSKVDDNADKSGNFIVGKFRYSLHFIKGNPYSYKVNFPRKDIWETDHKAGDVETEYDETFQAKNGNIVHRCCILTYVDSVKYTRLTTGYVLSLDDSGKYFTRYTYESFDDENFKNQYILVNGKPYYKNQIVRIFDEFDFSDGNWTAYVFSPYGYMLYKDYIPMYSSKHDGFKDISRNLNELTYGLYSQNFWSLCGSTSDTNLLNEMKDVFTFRIMGGYLTTAYLKIYLVRNGRLVYSSDLFARHPSGINHGFFDYIEAVYPDRMYSWLAKLKPTNIHEAMKYD